MLQVRLLDARAYSIHWGAASNTDRLTKFTQVIAEGAIAGDSIVAGTATGTP